MRRSPGTGHRYAADVVAFLFAVFVVLPLIELGVVITVADWIGVLPTIAALIALSAFGVWLVRHEGLGVVRRTRAAIARGETPGSQVLDGALIAFAGVLCVVPGFVTGVCGLVLLVPPVRRLVGRRLVRRWDRLSSSVGFTRRRQVVEVEWVGDVTPSRSAPSRPIELGPVDD